jgi:hypothetical protein
MLRPRYQWTCSETGCCQFVGGTDGYDIYMGKCNENPYDPAVVLVSDGGCEYEFGNQKEFASFVESVATVPEVERLGLALTFVQCFFPTPVRVAMDKMAKGEEL